MGEYVENVYYGPHAALQSATRTSQAAFDTAAGAELYEGGEEEGVPVHPLRRPLERRPCLGVLRA